MLELWLFLGKLLTLRGKRLIGFGILYGTNSSAESLLREESCLHLGQLGVKTETIFFLHHAHASTSPSPAMCNCEYIHAFSELLLPVI